MARRNQLFESVTTEGALLPSDFLSRLAQRDREIPGLTPDAYHLGSGEKLNEAISRSWNRVLGVWKSFAPASQQLPTTDAGTTLTREKWLLPLFQELGYGRLQTAKPFEFEGRRYSISHGWQHAPIHLVSFRADLDDRSENIVGARTTSPHSMVQELLNRSTPHVWGIVSNGYRVRLLRDNVSLTRQAFVEFDLQSMMQGELYADFALLWLLLHQSRVEGERVELCWLEKWAQEARQRGARALDQLRSGVEEAITALGSGFLAHPSNNGLRDKLTAGTLTKQDYFRQLLRVVYRFLFLFAAEDRELLHASVPEDATHEEREASLKIRANYLHHYSASRLRRIANRLGGTQHADLWHNVRLLFTWLGSETGCPTLGLPALGSFLWSARATPDLDDCLMANRDLLIAIRALAFTEQSKVRRPIDYKNIGTEELGSVYESLLEQHPDVHIPTAKFILGTHAGNERKTSGTHYTPPSLVNCVLDSALEPVLQEHECEYAKLGYKSAEEAILSLKVCDEAVGSGHFLIGAAHRMAKRLASVRTGDGEPAPAAIRHALRDVIGRCLYGVDINPMAVELCKFALWLEALQPGKPLSFLDHHIQCGNALLGTTPALMAQGIPDAAFESIEGDERGYCANFKKENRKELRQDSLFDRHERPWEHLGNLTLGLAQLASLPDNSVADVHAKENRYAELVHSSGYEFGRQLADAWCAAFVWKKCPPAAGGFDYPITNDIFQRLERNPHDAPKWMRDEIKRLADQYQFFHWHIAFPDVFGVPGGGKAINPDCGWNGGFDCILSNPPWDRLKLDEQEWFAERAPEIARAPTSALRKALLDALPENAPELFRQFSESRRVFEGINSFIRSSGNFPNGSGGELNLATLFAENFTRHANDRGRAGAVLPTTIVTDKSAQPLCRSWLERGQLIAVFDFENRLGLFPAVDSRYKFSVITLRGGRQTGATVQAAFYLQQPEEVARAENLLQITLADIAQVNPNTLSFPVSRTKRDAELLLAMHRQAEPLLLDSQEAEGGPWGYGVFFVFEMNKNSDLFVTEPDVETLPLLEAKLVHQFEHRAATFAGQLPRDFATGNARQSTPVELANAGFRAQPRFWVPFNAVDAAFKRGQLAHSWAVVAREITNSTNERTVLSCIIPKVGMGHTCWTLRLKKADAPLAAMLVANFNSFALDYCARQKVGGTHLSNFILKQLPMFIPTTYDQPCLWSIGNTFLHFLLSRVLELTYTAWDLEPFAVDCGWSGPPFRWDEERRFLLRSELDAAFFHLYGLNRDDTAYILDTFPIVKRKDEAKFSDYRTKLVILKIYDAMKSAMVTGKPYQTLLDPPPADSRCCHPLKVVTVKLELPTGPRQPAPNPQAYLMQLAILLLHRNQGTLTLDRMLEACALLSLPETLVEHAAIEFGDVAKRWQSRFRDKIQPDLFLPILRDFIDRGVIRLKGEGTGTLVMLTDANAVPRNQEVEFDAEIALAVVNSMAIPELETLPEMVPNEELEQFCKVG